MTGGIHSVQVILPSIRALFSSCADKSTWWRRCVFWGGGCAYLSGILICDCNNHWQCWTTFFSPLKALRARGSLSGFTRFLTFLYKAWLTGPFIDSPHVGRLWVVSRMRGGAAKCTMFFRHQQGRFSLNWDWLILAWACSDKLSTHLPSPRAQALALS